MFITIISFLVVFTVVAVVHELGHLIFSKRAGIAVPEFGIGFGPTLFSFTYHNTKYCLNLIPILGYVKISGIDASDEEEKNVPENQKYYNKPVGAKFMSIFAGPAMNLVLGFLIFSFIIMFTGIPDKISNEIATISPGSPAARIGLMAGDKIISVNNKNADDIEAAITIIHQSADKSVRLVIDRNGSKKVFEVVPKYNKQMKIALIGFSLTPLRHKVYPWQAFWYGLVQTASLCWFVLVLLGKLVIGKIALTDLAGPVGIAQISGQYASRGILSFLNFIGFFSINIAVINLIPLPALDGGRLFFILLEMVRRKAISIKLENKIHAWGLAALLTLMAFLTINDLLRIFRS